MTRHRHADGYRPPRRVDPIFLLIAGEIIGALVVVVGSVWLVVRLVLWIKS